MVIIQVITADITPLTTLIMVTEAMFITEEGFIKTREPLCIPTSVVGIATDMKIIANQEILTKEILLTTVAITTEMVANKFKHKHLKEVQAMTITTEISKAKALKVKANKEPLAMVTKTEIRQEVTTKTRVDITIRGVRTADMAHKAVANHRVTEALTEDN